MSHHHKVNRFLLADRRLPWTSAGLSFLNIRFLHDAYGHARLLQMDILHQLLQGGFPERGLFDIRSQQTQPRMSRRNHILPLQGTGEVPQGNGHGGSGSGIKYISYCGHVVRHERCDVPNPLVEAQ